MFSRSILRVSRFPKQSLASTRQISAVCSRPTTSFKLVTLALGTAGALYFSQYSARAEFQVEYNEETGEISFTKLFQQRASQFEDETKDPAFLEWIISGLLTEFSIDRLSQLSPFQIGAPESQNFVEIFANSRFYVVGGKDSEGKHYHMLDGSGSLVSATGPDDVLLILARHPATKGEPSWEDLDRCGIWVSGIELVMSTDSGLAFNIFGHPSRLTPAQTSALKLSLQKY